MEMILLFGLYLMKSNSSLESLEQIQATKSDCSSEGENPGYPWATESACARSEDGWFKLRDFIGSGSFTLFDSHQFAIGWSSTQSERGKNQEVSSQACRSETVGWPNSRAYRTQQL
ncbi:hypothetical protein HAX54_035443 [Datura stramonium]|uniref:Uncharacterized protein n=1 Tax=Datura stramonium TaxID=4076 RepID=A0ABS8SFJ9_DATST|nr:hypothetical protein [Datura stramonium]